MRANLVPVKGGRTISIVRDITLVGRQQGLCDLCIEKSSISKLHCLIVRTDGLLFIRDLGSTNGTKVNGQRVVRGALLPGDELAFASEKFKVEMGPGDPETDGDEHLLQTEMIPELPPVNGIENFSPKKATASVAPASPAKVDQNQTSRSDSDVRLLPDGET